MNRLILSDEKRSFIFGTPYLILLKFEIPFFSPNHLFARFFQGSSLSPEYYEALISRAAAVATAAVTNQRAGGGRSINQRSIAHHLSFDLQRGVVFPAPAQMKNLLQAVAAAKPHSSSSSSTRSPKWWIENPPPYSAVCPFEPPRDESSPGHDRNYTAPH